MRSAVISYTTTIDTITRIGALVWFKSPQKLKKLIKNTSERNEIYYVQIIVAKIVVCLNLPRGKIFFDEIILLYIFSVH